MQIFEAKKEQLVRIESISFKDENKEIRDIIGNKLNMEELFGLKFLKNNVKVKN